MNELTTFPASAEVEGAGAHILQALPHPVLRIDASGRLSYVNSAAENFLALSATVLRRMTINELLPEGNPLRTVIAHVLTGGVSVSEYEIELSTPRTSAQLVDVQVIPASDDSGTIIVMIQKRAIAQQIDRQLTHRSAARSVMGMSAMLAHEIKNPLAGIKGAAQLLETNVSPLDAELTKLICEETDRIASLVDRMEIFTDHRPMPRDLVNIHDVLDHVRRLVESGWGEKVTLVEDYDPSLPPLSANRDQLIQVFLNLAKNAVEALDGHPDGTITLSTAYRPGVRMRIPGTPDRVDLPLEVSVTDNGPGIPTDIEAHIFDPFVSTKMNGTGLGLALVAKIIGDHGGVIEYSTNKGLTAFRTRLPIMRDGLDDGDLNE